MIILPFKVKKFKDQSESESAFLTIDLLKQKYKDVKRASTGTMRFVLKECVIIKEGFHFLESQGLGQSGCLNSTSLTVE